MFLVFRQDLLNLVLRYYIARLEEAEKTLTTAEFCRAFRGRIHASKREHASTLEICESPKMGRSRKTKAEQESATKKAKLVKKARKGDDQ